MWKVFLDSIPGLVAGFIGGFGLEITRGVSKIIEDIWEDSRQSRKDIVQFKKNTVQQLLYDIPRGKALNFERTTMNKSEMEQRLAQIAVYDRKMSQKVGDYLNLWKTYATAKLSVQNGLRIEQYVHEEPIENEQIYLGDLLAELHKNYDEIIDTLNAWKK